MGGLWHSFVRPLLRQGAKTVGSEALVTGRNIISDIARNTEPDAKIRDIVRRNMTESVHMVINKLSGRRRKRKRVVTSAKIEGKVKKSKKKPKAKEKSDQSKRGRRKNYKTGHLLIAFIRAPSMAAEALSVSSLFDIFAHKPVQTSVQETVETTDPSRR